MCHLTLTYICARSGAADTLFITTDSLRYNTFTNLGRFGEPE